MGCCGSEDDVSEEHPHGKPKSFDPDFKGPIKNRSCTDIICCLIFFVFIIGYIVIGIFAWLNGDPVILLHPTDNQGRICGINYGDLNLADKPTLFYFDITKCASPVTAITFQCPTTQICLSSCPTTFWTYFPDIAITEAQLVASGNNRTAAAITLENSANNIWEKYICTYGFHPKDEFIKGLSIQEIILAGKCAPYYVPSTPVVQRCIPEVLANATSYLAAGEPLKDAAGNVITGTSLESGLKAIQEYLNLQSIATDIFSDVTASWYWLLVGFGIAAVVAFLWIVVMRWVAGPMVWITLIGIVALLTFGIWYCYDEYDSLKNTPGSDQSILSVGFTTNLSTYLSLTQTWLAFMIILAVVDIIIILVIIFLRKRILIAVQVINEASRAVGEMISTLFYPIITFVLVIISVAFWFATALFLASTGDPVYKVIDTNTASPVSEVGQSCNVTAWNQPSHQYYLNDSIKCVFDKYGGDSFFHNNVIWLQLIEVFGMLWITNWIIALGQMTLAGAFASYYWAWKKPQDIPFLPLYSSFGRALRYHTGSLAFGAFLIAVVQLIRIILEYIDHKLKGAENKVAKFIICCCKCCFWCLEKFLKFINRNAYIMVAVYGKNFCWSAKEAFKLLIRNILRVAVLDKVTDFLIFMGKLIVAVGMGALSWAFFTNKFASSLNLAAPKLNYYWFLIIVIGLGSYFIASGFFNTFGMAVDTIFLCFLEDLERNDGTPEKPYFMSKGLMKVLGKKNKKPKKPKDA